MTADAGLPARLREHLGEGGPDSLWATADLYLIGSRTTGCATEASDYDVIALTAHREGPELVLPRPGGAAAGPEVSVAVIGPAERARREQDGSLPGWAFDLGHARPLHLGLGIGEDYRRDVAGLWAARRAGHGQALAAATGVHLRQGHGAVRHGQQPAAQLILALAVDGVLRLTALAHCGGLPAEKWLPRLVRSAPRGPEIVRIAENLGRGGLSLTEVADALDRLAVLMDELVDELVDERDR